MFNHFLLDGKVWRSDLRQRDPGFTLRLEDEQGQSSEARLSDFERVGPDRFRFRLGQKPVEGRFAFEGDRLFLLIGGRSYRIQQQAPRSDAEGVLGAKILAPMPGRVLLVHVEVGQRVAAETALVTLEAMKMEQTLRSRGEAVIQALHCAVGEVVSAEQLLVELAPAEG